MEQPTEPDRATRIAEEAEAGRSASADRPATDREADIADDAYARGDGEQRRQVAEHEQEMMDIGAHVKGEGVIE